MLLSIFSHPTSVRLFVTIAPIPCLWVMWSKSRVSNTSAARVVGKRKPDQKPIQILLFLFGRGEFFFISYFVRQSFWITRKTFDCQEYSNCLTIQFLSSNDCLNSESKGKNLSNWFLFSRHYR